MCGAKNMYPYMQITIRRKREPFSKRYNILTKRFNDLAYLQYSERSNMRDKKKHNLKVYGQSGYKYKETPTIILKGQWLKDAGFNIGDNISLECDAGIIIIKNSTQHMVCAKLLKVVFFKIALNADKKIGAERLKLLRFF